MIYNDSDDLQPIKLILGWLLYPFSALLISIIINKLYGNLNIFLCFRWIVGIFIIQAVISLLMFIVPDIRNSILSLIAVDSMDTMNKLGDFRLIAFAKPELQYANMAVLYGITTYILYILQKGKQIRTLFYFTALSLFAIAGILSGRSYIIMIILMISIIFFTRLKSNLFAAVKYIIYTILVCGIGVTGVIVWLNNNGYEETYKWAFEAFINYQESGSLEMRSADVMKSMYVFPENLSTWIIGDARIADKINGGFYMHTDIGYLRFLYCWGLIGSLIMYISQLMMYKETFKIQINIYIKSLFSFIIIWTFIYLAKEMYNCYIWFCIFLACGLPDKKISYE